MVYINYNADKIGSHGNPTSVKFPGMVAIPESMLGEYLEHFGFVFLTVSDGVVSKLTPNSDAINTYMDDVEGGDQVDTEF